MNIFKPVEPNKNNIITFYVKSNDSNTYISLYTNNYLNKPSYKLLKVYSFGNLNKEKQKRKNNLFIGQMVNLSVLYALKNGYRYANVFFSGFSTLRRIIITNIIEFKYKFRKLKLLSIIDKTNIPFNGCKIQKDKKR